MDVNLVAPAYEPIVVEQPRPAQTAPAPPPVLAERAVVKNQSVQEYESAEWENPDGTLMSEEFVARTIDQINKSISFYNREMRISIHEETQRIMVKVMDTDNDRVIREIPPKKILDAFARTLQLAGILLDKRQ